MPEVGKFTIKQLLKLHDAGGILHTTPSIPFHAIRTSIDTPEGDRLVSLWQAFVAAKDELDAMIKELESQHG